MTNVIISSYEMLPTDADGLMIEENVSLSFEEIKILYTVQADDHSKGDEHEIEYDVAAGV
jgi:type VI secretion system secreted protein Hcp